MIYNKLKYIISWTLVTILNIILAFQKSDNLIDNNTRWICIAIAICSMLIVWNLQKNKAHQTKEVSTLPRQQDK